MPRIRRITPIEWLYLCMEPELPPFAIQLRIALARLPSVDALTRALAACVDANPASRLQVRGRWWWEEGRIPGVVCIEEGVPFSLDHPALHRRLPIDVPPIELLWWPGAGLVLRCAHALMDAAGLLHFAQDLFRALRGEPLLGSRRDLDDWSLLTSSPHRRPLPALRPAWRSPAGEPSSTASAGHAHAMRQVRGRVDSPTARIAAALARTGACRLMIPVDLRLADAGLRTTANLSNPLILDFDAGWDSTACWRHVLGALGRHEQFGVARASAALPRLPARATGRVLGAANRWQARHGRHLVTALSSNLARVSLASFAFEGETPAHVGLLPFDTPGAGLNLLTLQHDDALEIAASCPAASGDEGRLDRLLDAVCAELERGVSVRAAKAVPAIAIAATFVAEPLAGVLASWMTTLGLPLAPVFAPYGQVLQALADPRSAFARNRDGVNVVLLRLEDAWRARPGDEATLREHVDELLAALARTAARGEAPLVVWLAPLSPGVRRDALPTLLQEEVERAIKGIDGLHVLDDEHVRRWYPVAQEDAPLSDALGHVPFSRDRCAALASALARTVAGLVLPPPKVIVVDCDNTLWRGVCAEQGPQGVEVTPSHRALQAWLVAQVDAGRLVCLASRNEPSDVDAVFAQNAGMLLRPEHVVARRIGWQPKSESVRALADELRLGLDSVVFIDDNPVECTEVQARCAGVQVLRLPEEAEIAPWLDHLWTLEPVPRTDTLSRTRQYREEGERAALRATSSDFQVFLDALELQVRIEPPGDDEWERVAELSRRTNQFNLAPQPRTAAHFRALAPAAQCLAVHVADRFGDYGLTGVLVYRVEARSLRVDAWMLSCRVLGRGVEHRVLDGLGDVAATAGCDDIVFAFERSARNAPALTFLEGACERVDDKHFRVLARDARDARVRAAPGPADASEPAMPAPPRATGLAAGVLDLVARERRDVARIRAAAGEGAAAARDDDLLAGLLALAVSASDGLLVAATPDDSLVELGMDSLQIVTLLDEAARVYGPGRDAATFDAGLGRFLDNPTLRELASTLQRLAREQGA